MDFGTTVIGEQLKRSFILRNKGAKGTTFEFVKLSPNRFGPGAASTTPTATVEEVEAAEEVSHVLSGLLCFIEMFEIGWKMCERLIIQMPHVSTFSYNETFSKLCIEPLSSGLYDALLTISMISTEKSTQLRLYVKVI